MTQSSVSLRPVRRDDANELAELRVIAMRPSLEAIGRFDHQRSRTRFLDAFDPELTREVVVAGNRIGFVVVRSVEEHLLLDHIYIQPPAQGSGIGSEVLKLVIAEARSAKKVLRLCALKQSASNTFYMKHGFKLQSVSDWDNYYELAPSEA